MDIKKIIVGLASFLISHQVYADLDIVEECTTLRGNTVYHCSEKDNDGDGQTDRVVCTEHYQGGYEYCTYVPGDFWGLEGGGNEDPDNPYNDGGGSNLLENEDSSSDEKDADACKSTESNPIVISTGNKIQPETDYLANGEFPLIVNRTYNNFYDGSSIFGKKWTTPLSNQLFIDSDGIKAKRQNGTFVLLSFNVETNRWEDDLSNPIYIITLDSNNNYLLSNNSDYTEQYSPGGKLKKLIHATGVTHTFSYSNGKLIRVTHSNGRYLEFTWSNGKVSKITDNAGNEYLYTYDGNGYLKKATIPGSPKLIKDYYYNDSRFPGALTQVNINGKKYATYAYHSNGKAYSSSHWAWDNLEVERSEFTYSDWLTSVKNPLGHSTGYRYTSLSGAKVLKKVERASAVDCPAATRSVSYSEDGKLDTKVDWMGNLMDYDYDSGGKLSKITYAKNSSEQKIVNYTWVAGQSKIKSVETSELKVVNNYDDKGRVISVEEINKSGYGVPGEVRKTTYSYENHTNNVLAKLVIDGPRTDISDTTTFNYDESGNLISVINALGQTITYGNHDALGNPRRVTSSNGLITDYTYDAQGKILTQKVHHPAGIQTTSFEYNPMGQVTKITFPDGNYLENTYDQAFRLIKTADKRGAYISYTRNTNSDVVTKKIMQEFITFELPEGCLDPFDSFPGGGDLSLFIEGSNCEPVQTSDFLPVQKEDFEYDVMGRLQTRLGGSGQRTDYDYDNNSNITEVADAYGNKTTFTYDGLNRIISTKDANNGIVTYSYDASGRVHTVTDSRGLTTTYNYSGFGDLEELISPDTGTTTYDYNKSGQVARMVRGSGTVSTFTYDALGRITSEKHGSMTKTYVYDSGTNRTGRLYYVNDSSGQAVYWYDSVGNITRKRSKFGGVYYNTYYTYDGMNRLTSMTYPSGRKALYSYDDMGRVSQVRYAKGSTIKVVASDLKYRPFGPLSELTYGNSAVRQITHDFSYRPTHIQTSGLQDLTYTYDKKDNITKITNNVVSAATQSYSYDAIGRLKSVSGYKANTYTYDAVGNRKSQIKNGVTETYAYSSNSNRISSLNVNGIKTAYSYNSNGQTIQKGNNSFSYNSENRLTKHIGPIGKWTDYEYNALGQRVSKVDSTSTTRFFYDEAGRLTAELSVSDNRWKEYIYLHGQVVGFAVNGSLYYVHSDHLGRAERITNSSQSTVWQANNHDFDRVVVSGSADWYNLGFPGQYWDSEKGSYYNYFRDYDPSTGRYLQSDPIGLVGGMNTYAYVHSNPIKNVDFYGLAASDVICPCDKRSRGLKGGRMATISQEQADQLNPRRGTVAGRQNALRSFLVGVMTLPANPVLGLSFGGASSFYFNEAHQPAYLENGHQVVRSFWSHDNGTHFSQVTEIFDREGNLLERDVIDAQCE